jgi:hypothetical protein
VAVGNPLEMGVSIGKSPINSVLPSGNDCYIAIEAMAHRKFVDLPIKDGWIFHSYVVNVC